MYVNIIKDHIRKKIEICEDDGFTDWPERFLEICDEIIDNYGESTCKDIVLHGQYNSYLCPFCVRECEIKGTKCAECEFGKRFGQCASDEDNLFDLLPLTLDVWPELIEINESYGVFIDG
jgi:hypothetical protein